MSAVAPAVELSGITTRFGIQLVHDRLDLTVMQGEFLSLIGGSGTGKSVLLRIMSGIMRPHDGEVRLFGQPLHQEPVSPPPIGVLFQGGALFTSLTVSENIQLAIKARFDLPNRLLEELAHMKLALVGLPCETGAQYPNTLSGGMIKRAGLARALALDPNLLFLDEPTAGLDPVSASDFDGLIETLQTQLGITVIMITHDVDSLRRLSDRVAVLINKKAMVSDLQAATMIDDPWIKEYFGGPRGRAAGLMAADHKNAAPSYAVDADAGQREIGD